MKPLTCEMCGSTNLIKHDGLFVCQSCGTKYSVEEAKRMMIEGTVVVEGTVKIDTSEELKNLYEVARRTRLMGDENKAEEFYKLILLKEPKNWEANYFTTFYHAKNIDLKNKKSALDALNKSFTFIFDLIRENIEESEQLEIINSIYNDIYTLTTVLHDPIKYQFRCTDYNVRLYNTRNYLDIVNPPEILYSMGNSILNIWSNSDIQLVGLKALDNGTILHGEELQYLKNKREAKKTIIQNITKIKETKPSYEIRSRFKADYYKDFPLLWNLWNMFVTDGKNNK